MKGDYKNAIEYLGKSKQVNSNNVHGIKMIRKMKGKRN